jgi:hypothetical protein
VVEQRRGERIPGGEVGRRPKAQSLIGRRQSVRRYGPSVQNPNGQSGRGQNLAGLYVTRRYYHRCGVAQGFSECGNEDPHPDHQSERA